MKKSFSELESLVLLNRLSTGGGREVLSLLLDGTQASEITERILSEDLFGKQGAMEMLLDVFSPEREIEICTEKGIDFLTLNDSGYPFLLRHISDPPVLLYKKGHILETDQAAAAVVGSRYPSIYGLTQARRFASGLAESGLTVVSGHARGIDQAAHEGALLIPYGRTVAVLGCGLDVDYPPKRGSLSEKILERGAVISEYALGTPPRAENFPRRNRIISGLSLGVLVVEARERSGSLITAHEAVEQGREVFAVPGPVDQLTSRGSHQLLKEGAMLAENPADILEALAEVLWPFVPVSRPAAGPGGISSPAVEREPALSSSEKDLMDTLETGAMASDQIAGRLGWQFSALLPVLTRLELRGKIRKTYDGCFSVRR